MSHTIHARTQLSGDCTSEVHPDNEGICVQVFDMASSTGQGGAGVEVTGPEDPLRLTVSHTLNTSTLSLTLSFQAFNRLTVEIKGAGVR